MQKADQPVPGRVPLHDPHHELLVVRSHVGVLVDRGEFELLRRHFVVTRLHGHAQPEEVRLDGLDVGHHAVVDCAEVVVVQLLALRRPGAEKGATRVDEVRTAVVELLVDQKVLLLGPKIGRDATRVVSEERQRSPSDPVQRIDRPEQRGLVVKAVAGPAHENGGNTEVGRALAGQDERRRCRIPGRVAAGLVGEAESARGEGGRVGLALDQLVAPELGQRTAVPAHLEEGVVLLGRAAGQRLEHMREMRSATRQRPVLQRRGHGVGDFQRRLVAVFDCGQQLFVGAFGQTVLHLREPE